MKKISALLLTVIIAFSFCVPAFAEVVHYGDLDGNTKVDTVDFMRLKKYLVGQTVEINITNADVNDDGEITVLDVIRFKKYLAGQNVTLGIKSVTGKTIADTPLSQRYSNYLSFRGHPYAIGIDVSTHNKEIDWQKVKDYGVEFAMIRAGYRGYGVDTPNLKTDARFEENIQGALAVGLPVGVYFYSSAITEEEAIEEANYVLDLVKDYEITLPIAFDFEELNLSTPDDEHRASDLSDEQMKLNAAAFIKTVEDAGYKGILYGSKRYYENHYGKEYVDNVYTWMANYTNECDTLYDGYFDMWQLASDGQVDGIEGYVDINIMYNCFYKESEQE